MSKFSIVRKIEIDAAHRVPHHESKCFNLHGHRYVINACLEGDVFEEGEQNGMVMDFGFIKQIMMDVIHENADHATIFWSEDVMLSTIGGAEQLSVNGIAHTIGNGWKILLVPMVPTAENLAQYWYDEVQTAIDDYFRNIGTHLRPALKYLEIYETPNCSARYPV